jgi:hypothetical protein
MKRSAVIRIVVSVVGFCMAFACSVLLAGPPLWADDSAPEGTLTHYIMGSNNVDQLTATTLAMYHRGDWVELKGPITISVLVWHTDDPSTVTNTVILKSGQTVTIGVDEYSETHPGDWNATITLVSYQEVELRGLLELVFGTGDFQMFQEFLDKHLAKYDESDASARAQPVLDKFNEFIAAAGGKSAFPNSAKAGSLLKTIATMSNLRDKNTEEPLFPSLRLKGVQSLLTQMVLMTAQDSSAFPTASTVFSLVLGHDIDRANAEATP